MAGEPERVVRDYFAALGRRDLEAARAHLAPQLRGDVRAQLERMR